MFRRLLFPVLLGLCGCAVLIGLGSWQLQRLAWKQGILDEIAARITAAPVPLPEAPDPEADRYLPVVVEGDFLPGHVDVLVGLKGQGPGFRVISPLRTTDGRTIMVDRGFVREAERGAIGQPQGVRLVGNLHWPDDTSSSTPPPDLGRNIWFARDVAAMAETLGTAPVLVVLRESSDADPLLTPMPVDTSGIPNDHLQYAITWFGLALVWAGMTAYWIRRITRTTT